MKTCENCGKHETPECSKACTLENQIGWEQKELCKSCQRKNCSGTLCLHEEWFIPDDQDVAKQQYILFPILNGLTPTTESCTMKVLEEVGELMQMIGKHSGLSGERQTMSEEVRIRRTVFEALDVAQSAITMAHTLCKLYELSLESFIERHESKLIQKGYLVRA